MNATETAVPFPNRHSLFSTFSLGRVAVKLSFETDDCYITLLTTRIGKKYISKAIKSKEASEQALLIIDCVASEIAKNAALPVNDVILLTKQQPWISKGSGHSISTLHEYVKGCPASDSLPWEDFSLQQRFSRPPGSKLWNLFGRLAESEKGLSRQVIITMSKNPQLSRIAALDTFLGNADRSEPNIYYDRAESSFFGIDQAASFRRPLAALAIKQLEFLSKEGFSAEERAGLKVYLSTLRTLIAAVTPRQMSQKIHIIAKSSGLRGIESRIKAASRNFSNNYRDTQRLTAVLDDVLSRKLAFILYIYTKVDSLESVSNIQGQKV